MPDSASLIEPGRKAPAFHLPDQTGEKHRLSACAGRPVVLYFYPRDSTPGCTKQACGFRDAEQALAETNTAVFGVSPDDAASHEKFAAKQGLNFPLLVDTDQMVARAYGVWGEKKMYGKTFEGIVRTTYLIGPDGKVARRWDKVRVPGHVDEVIAAIGELA